MNDLERIEAKIDKLLARMPVSPRAVESLARAARDRISDDALQRIGERVLEDMKNATAAQRQLAVPIEEAIEMFQSWCVQYGASATGTSVEADAQEEMHRAKGALVEAIKVWL